MLFTPPIVKRVVEAHQGRVEVQSKVGEGTTFIVTLPSDLQASETASLNLTSPTVWPYRFKLR